MDEGAGIRSDRVEATFSPAKPRYPKIRVRLTGVNGNAFNVIAVVRDSLRKKKVSEELISEFTRQAMSGDYDNVLYTCMSWVNVS